MDDNKVTMSLEKYNELYENIKSKEIKLQEMTSLILNYTELNDKGNSLIMDSYHAKYGRLLDIVKELNPKEYETRLQELKKEED